MNYKLYIQEKNIEYWALFGIVGGVMESLLRTLYSIGEEDYEIRVRGGF